MTTTITTVTTIAITKGDESLTIIEFIYIVMVDGYRILELMVI